MNALRSTDENRRLIFCIMVNNLHKLYERFIRIRGNPREIALGFALGLFIGLSPTMGVQMPIAVFFASILKWNKYSAAIAVWITNPLTAPFIYSGTYIIGATLTGAGNSFRLTGNFDWNMLSQMIEKSPAIIVSLFAGGFVVGLPLAVLGYFLSYNAVEKYQRNLKEKLRLKKEKLKSKVFKKKVDQAAALDCNPNTRQRSDVSSIEALCFEDFDPPQERRPDRVSRQ